MKAETYRAIKRYHEVLVSGITEDVPSGGFCRDEIIAVLAKHKEAYFDAVINNEGIEGENTKAIGY